MTTESFVTGRPRGSSIDSTSSSGSSRSEGSAAAVATSPRVLPARSKTVYHPVVSSMIFSNTLRDCSQVDDMIRHCMNHANGGENSFVCETAKRYQALCNSRHHS